ncbi:predicted protein [Nematostella vectensis]|uniref:Uncharacterized protein n=1 Tax=Nematostella vectensis TaxID=45351 RepID=A7T372_NEMVE|nr:predicted protein [Nematostella vectensis]|eukprot:XP_001621693.1 hypothetical protein NEMVEDRAFT_v1g221688 [Nematostella vectensis]
MGASDTPLKSAVAACHTLFLNQIVSRGGAHAQDRDVVPRDTLPGGAHAQNRDVVPRDTLPGGAHAQERDVVPRDTLPGGAHAQDRDVVPRDTLPGGAHAQNRDVVPRDTLPGGAHAQNRDVVPRDTLPGGAPSKRRNKSGAHSKRRRKVPRYSLPGGAHAQNRDVVPRDTLPGGAHAQDRDVVPRDTLPGGAHAQDRDVVPRDTLPGGAHAQNRDVVPRDTLPGGAPSKRRNKSGAHSKRRRKVPRYSLPGGAHAQDRDVVPRDTLPDETHVQNRDVSLDGLAGLIIPRKRSTRRKTPLWDTVYSSDSDCGSMSSVYEPNSTESDSDEWSKSGEEEFSLRMDTLKKKVFGAKQKLTLSSASIEKEADLGGSEPEQMTKLPLQTCLTNSKMNIKDCETEPDEDEAEPDEDETISNPVEPAQESSNPTSHKEGITISEKKCHACLFCGKSFTCKMARHIKRSHGSETKVMAAVTSKDPQKAFEKLRLEGDFHHNQKVLETGVGEIIVVRRQGTGGADCYSPCPSCNGFYKSNELYRHKCAFKSDNTKTKSMKMQSRMLLSCKTNEGSFDSMRNDEVGFIAKTDELIRGFGERLTEKGGADKKKNVSQKMRELSRLLLGVRQKKPNISMKELINPKYFDDVVGTVKEMCGFSGSKRLDIATPSLAIKLQHDLKKCSMIVMGWGLKSNDDALAKRGTDFARLIDNEWSERISSRAKATLSKKRHNREYVLPLAEDLVKLSRHLDNKISHLTDQVKAGGILTEWRKLAKVTLVKIITFNKRRSGETSQLEVEQFLKRPKWEQCSNALKEGLTPVEAQLCTRLDLVEIVGKHDRKVPVILTKPMVEAIDILIAKRPIEVAKNNKYVFAATMGSMSYLKGWNCLKEVLKEVDGLEAPKKITGTNLRKYIATVSQLGALTQTDMDWLARHLGHDVHVHREFYRLHESTAELAKVSKLLIAVDEGRISHLKGKSLEEISLEGELL